MTTPDMVLDTAADLIARWGWHQGSSRDTSPDRLIAESARCASAAILDARFETGATYAAMAAAREAFARRVDPLFNGVEDDPPGAIGRWNDHPNRTLEHVLAALRAGAVSLRAVKA